MQSQTKLATLGGGCFWCVEAVYRRVIGVSDIKPGYSNGTTINPTYKDVCTGKTGHIEVIQLKYDQNMISYDNLLRIFFAIHDPTTRDKQGEDEGTQYRSVILYNDDEQKNIAHQVIKEISESKKYQSPIVTDVEKLASFYEAEQNHKNYYYLNQEQGYCKGVIEPKLKKFLQNFKNFTQ